MCILLLYKKEGNDKRLFIVKKEIFTLKCCASGKKNKQNIDNIEE